MDKWRFRSRPFFSVSFWVLTGICTSLILHLSPLLGPTFTSHSCLTTPSILLIPAIFLHYQPRCRVSSPNVDHSIPTAVATRLTEFLQQIVCCWKYFLSANHKVRESGGVGYYLKLEDSMTKPLGCRLSKQKTIPRSSSLHMALLW